MLKEMKEVRQIQGEGFRRWFTDEFFDLFVWYNAHHAQQIKGTDDIIGFQLCYDKNNKERALTWKKNYGFTHDGIDDGESRATEDRTPILVQDGLFDTKAIAKQFKENGKEMDQVILKFVLDRIKKYGR